MTESKAPTNVELASQLGVSAPTARDWRSSLPFLPDGPLDIGALARAWMKARRAASSSSAPQGKQSELDDAKLATAKSQARIAAVEAAVAEGRVISREEAKAILVRRHAEVRSALAQWPRRFARRLAQQPPEVVEQELEDAVNEVMDGFSRADPLFHGDDREAAAPRRARRR